MASIAFVNIYQNKVSRGAETFVKELSKRLAINNEVKVFSANQSPKNRWPFLWRFYLDPFGIQTFWQTLKFVSEIWHRKYDFVIPVNGGWQPAIIRLLTWLYGGKMIVSGQSGKGWDDRNNLWCFPDTFIALTDYGKMWAKKVNPFIKIEKIPNGVDLNKFSFSARGESSFGRKGNNLGINLKKPIVICQGALVPSKRLHLAILAVSQMKTANLLLVGRGSLKNELQLMGKKLLGERFDIRDFTFDKMPEVYRLGSVFTLPSWSSEAFGISYVEAMATNLPVVATNDAIRREIIGDAGFFIDPVNTSDYARALEHALAKDWRGIPRTQAERFDWDIISKKYEVLLHQLNR